MTEEKPVSMQETQVVGIPVVEVEGDGDLAQTLFRRDPLHHRHGPLAQIAQQGLVGVVPGPLGDLEDDGRLGFETGQDDRLELFHVVEVVGRNREAPVDGGGEHGPRVDEAEVSITDHDDSLPFERFKKGKSPWRS